MDTLKFVVNKNDFNRNEILEIIRKNKFILIRRQENKHGELLTYRYKNFLFFLSDTSLKASGGLLKLLYGNNLDNYSFKDNCKALDYLKHILGNDIFNKAKIARIDFAVTLNMSEPAMKYIDLLVNPKNSRFDNINNESKYFESYKEKQIFYDKGKSIINEAKRNGKTLYRVPSENLLRYEIRFEKNLKKTLELKDLSLCNLYDIELYFKLLNFWYDGYQKVRKDTDAKVPDSFPEKSALEMKEFLLSHGINAVGGLEAVKSKLCKKSIKPYVRKDMLDYLKKHFQEMPVNENLQSELNNKVDQYYDGVFVLNELDQTSKIRYLKPGLRSA